MSSWLVTLAVIGWPFSLGWLARSWLADYHDDRRWEQGCRCDYLTSREAHDHE